MNKKKQATILPMDIETDINKVGIIPRTLSKIMTDNYDEINADRLNIYISFLQVYNEKVFDLLQDDMVALEIHEDASKGIYIESLTEFHVKSLEESIY
jgi:hypothetical protein